MIHPNMATMLAFLVTDALVPQEALRAGWRRVVERTFNQVTVDGDTSTNDLALLMANGAYGEVPLKAFFEGVEAVAQELARMIARDGEGATKLMVVRVVGAATEEEARRAARAIAGSALWKSALYGNDPNWGGSWPPSATRGPGLTPCGCASFSRGFPSTRAGFFPLTGRRRAGPCGPRRWRSWWTSGRGKGQGGLRLRPHRGLRAHQRPLHHLSLI